MSLTALLVEDEASYKKIIEIRLKNWDSALVITHAKTITEARAVLDKVAAPFSLVILDQNLPDGYGWTLLDHPKLAGSAVLAISSDDSADLPAQTVRAGADHFLGKKQISEPLFIPLIQALIQRKGLEEELLQAKITASRMDTVKTLLATLRHEINNPLGAVLGGAYLIRSKGELESGQSDAVRLIEESSRRIKHVLDQLCETADLQAVTKAQEQVFQIPGDKPWEGSKKD